MSCRYFLPDVCCRCTVEKIGCNQMWPSFFQVLLTVFIAVSPIVIEVASAQEAGTNRGVQERPVFPAESMLESVGPATSQTDRADGTGNLALGRERRPLYRFNKSDVLEISFAFAPEFNQTATIQPDGFISLKQVEPIFAEGATARELERLIAEAYVK